MELAISEWCGRLGNNLIQVCNMILFCKKYHIKCCQVLDHSVIGKFNYDFSSNNTDVNINVEYLYIILNRCFMNSGYQFYDSEDCPNFCKAFYPDKIMKEEIITIYRDFIYPILKVSKNQSPLDENTLVIHIRSGDEIVRPGFSEDHNHNVVHNNIKSYLSGTQNIVYTIPPLIAYEKIINLFEKVIIVSEDRLNPVINSLQEKYFEKVTVQTNSLQEDIELILSAKNLAFASIFNSTFAHVLSYLSPKIENVYIFDCILRNTDNDYHYSDAINVNIVHIKDYYDNYSLKNILTWAGNVELYKSNYN